MDSSRRLVPAFIKNIDRKLLLNNPSVWSARTHLVLYFSFLFAAILALFCALIYTDARQNSNVYVLTGFVVVIAIIGFVFWLIYLLRFNVFKRFGNWEARDGLRTFGLFFINILVMVAIPFIPTAVETFMANRHFSDTELVNDVNELNINANLLEHDKLPLVWKADTFNIFKSTYEIVKDADTIWNSTVPLSDSFEPNNFKISDRELISKLDFADSLIKINDCRYIFFTVPDYIYVSAYDVEDISSVRKLGKKEIYDVSVKNYKKPDIGRLTARMDELKKKYAYYGNDYYNSYEVEADELNSYHEYVMKKYSLYKINSTIETVAQKKYRWRSGWIFFLHFMYYATLVLSLLVFIFRHSTKKTFFLAILTGVILAIITSLFVVMFGGNEKSFFILLILYFIGFTVIGFSVSAAKTRTVFQGIALNFFLFALPLMPLLLTGFYFETIIDTESLNDTYIQKSRYYFYAEVFGFILVLLLLEPVFKKLYRNWYSLPEE